MNREQALLEEKNDIPILNMLDAGNLPIDKSRPARSIIVIFSSLLVGMGSWIWLNREWIRERLVADDNESRIADQECVK
jgi:LPS O-antigen subunit length determinant protein (WzzB/FepE family)